MASSLVVSPTAASVGGAPVVMMSEADIILPPPTPVNPIPSLPAALRLDNQEQLVSLLATDPTINSNTLIGGGVSSPAAAVGGTGATTFRQVLVFENDSFRTLLLRQVLKDMDSQKQPGKMGPNNTKKNWQGMSQFTFPKVLQASIVGTQILNDKNNNDSNNNNIAKQHVDVMTYFLRPWDTNNSTTLSKMEAIYSKIRKNPKVQHHRLVFVPHITASVSKVLQDSGIMAAAAASSTATPSTSASSAGVAGVSSSSLAKDNKGNVSVVSLQMDIFPLESDVLSLEYHPVMTPDTPPSEFVTTCARALLKIQDVIGKVPRIQSIAPTGEEVLQKLLAMTVEDDDQQQHQHQQQIHYNHQEHTTSSSNSNDRGVHHTAIPLPDNDRAMLLIDRKVDMVTPMVTPLTYEGLLDEVVGIDCGYIKIPESTINPDDDDEKKTPPNKNSSDDGDDRVVLGVHAGDSLYREVRNQHVEQFGTFLQNQARALKESHANFTNKGTQKDLQEIHQFVKQIPMFTQNLRSLTNHIHLAELIKASTEDVSFREQWQTERSMIEGDICHDILEEWIASGYPVYKVLRLLCLQSLCAGGLKSSRYDSFKAQIVQVYGYETLPLLHQLESLGWIRRKDTLWMDSAGSSSFGSLRRSLVLINAEVDTVEPDDISYVSSGYAPLTVRLVQAAIQGWTASKEEVLKELPGRLLDIQQCEPPLDLASTLKLQTPPKGESLGQYASHSAASKRGKKPTLVVFYLGGITYMEIAALRFLSKRETFPYHIIMVTTRVINGTSLLQSLE